MKSVIGKAFFLSLAAATMAAAGCSQGPSAGGNGGHQVGEDGTGTVGLALTLPGGEQINTVSFKLTNGTTTITGTIDVTNSNTVTTVVPNVPAGSNYTVTLTATSVDGTVQCSGTSAPFSVANMANTVVNVPLSCIKNQDAGSVVINGIPSNCAKWDTLVANPMTATTGSSVGLFGHASGPDPNSVTYMWTAPSGTIAAPTSADTTFTCPATPGTITVTLMVADGPIPDGGVCPASATTGTTTVNCVSPAGVDAGAPDASPDVAADVSPDVTPDVVSEPDVVTTPPLVCDGNTSGICTPTETLIIEKSHDCYECMVNFSCIDDDVNSDSGNECGDLPASAGTLGGSAGCLSTLSCILGVPLAGGVPVNPAPGPITASCAGDGAGADTTGGGLGDGGSAPGGPSNCYCGSADPGSACSAAAAATTVNGICIAPEVAGLGFPATDNTHVLQVFKDKGRPSGMANAILGCAVANVSADARCKACIE